MRSYLIVVISLLAAAPAAAQNQTGMLEPITIAEYLKMPDSVQTMYVAGAMGGIAFMAYTYSPDQYPAWVKCVRMQTLGKTNEDVVALLKANPAFNETVVSALAQSIGKRCRH
jgi:hypothetical protein